MAEDGRDMAPTRADIEANIETLKASIREMSEESMEISHGTMRWAQDYLPHHPAWGEEWQDLIASERRHGVETGPPIAPYETEERWQTMDRWQQEMWNAGHEQGPVALSERLSQGRAETGTATERLSQIVAAKREQTQEKDLGHGY